MLLAGAILLVGLSWLTLSGRWPSLASPWCLSVVFPVFIAEAEFGGWQEAGLAAMPLAFLIWCGAAMDGRARVPIRSYVLLGLLVIGSAIYLYSGWDYALGYHTVGYVRGVVIMNVGCWLALFGLACLAWRHPRPALNDALHVAMFAWLTWCAFPYMGGLP